VSSISFVLDSWSVGILSSFNPWSGVKVGVEVVEVPLVVVLAEPVTSGPIGDGKMTGIAMRTQRLTIDLKAFMYFKYPSGKVPNSQVHRNFSPASEESGVVPCVAYAQFDLCCHWRQRSAKAGRR
jgi:hypothetical protein